MPALNAMQLSTEQKKSALVMIAYAVAHSALLGPKQINGLANPKYLSMFQTPDELGSVADEISKDMHKALVELVYETTERRQRMVDIEMQWFLRELEEAVDCDAD